MQRHAEFRYNLSGSSLPSAVSRRPRSTSPVSHSSIIASMVDRIRRPACFDQRRQQSFAIVEMMRDAGIGHASLARHRADLDCLDATFGQ